MPGRGKTPAHDQATTPLQLRPASTVLDLERLGSLHPYRLSFMRILLRHVMNERWQIHCKTWDLDAEGYGTAIYTIDAPHGRFSFVVFADYLEPARRSDRVIADQWDMTVTLCAGDVDDEQMQMLRANVPLQEAGRVDARCIVLSRANKSSRNFDYVIGELAAGRQPALETIARIGYLYRTTAVYGSGKFGMADWLKVRSTHPDFARPFAAEMFTCYMIREFSLAQADHIAHARAPGTAVKMDAAIKRYFGIGNATGLGMAPFLINHPQLISRWVEVRETALARVIRYGSPTAENRGYLQCLLQKASLHLRQIATDNELQNKCNATVIGELDDIHDWAGSRELLDWAELVEHASQCVSPETQELINSLLMELYPELTDELEDALCVDESLELMPGQSLADTKALIENHYDWALDIDFSEPHCRDVFWYRSMEKSEPRLGQRGVDPGEDKAMPLAVAYDVRQCYDLICASIEAGACQSVAEFAIRFPELRSTLRRVQSLTQSAYGDIRTNLLDADVLPIHLLRCKLSFFGVSKFDPKSRLWVRNTMFQGAPLADDIGADFADDWYFPVMPTMQQRRLN
ncbi:MAG: hypothetical protein GTN98_00845 [Woeseiaceae bacterium]|nr:hypothetical protein [Woeseiaceae bacterium]